MLMNQSSRAYAFVEFIIRDEAALHRLSTVVDEFRRQKQGDAIADDYYWLSYFEPADRAEFWWPTEAEVELYNKFWFSVPLPERHGPKMPAPPWDFGSMVDAILSGEYDVVGVRKLDAERARLEINPHAYPYGDISASGALVRSFGHKVIGFDDGTGFNAGDLQSPRWNPEMTAPNLKQRGLLDRLKLR